MPNVASVAQDQSAHSSCKDELCPLKSHAIFIGLISGHYGSQSENTDADASFLGYS
ncbi:hypothetical protein DPMN_131215 [Dreissena polymorpha]|uniref:Uncharacterized protein n=1 Tax=Dreissena polymorpha TaxID=45954 RepID=A0A9D4JZ49_DREPO|nr:hypothetical protein DPMN_131215 [Dreissena polymorpha]